MAVAYWRTRRDRQQLIGAWAMAAFGDHEALSIEQRGIRQMEESAELGQAAGVSEEMAHRIVSEVYKRPAGNLRQEMGGVAVTLLALGHAANIDADRAELDEVNRVLDKPLAHFAERNRKKNEAGLVAPNPEVRAELRRAGGGYVVVVMGHELGSRSFSGETPHAAWKEACAAGVIWEWS